jgi:hypothetical protein
MTDNLQAERPVVVADNRGRVSLTKHAGIKPGQMFFISLDAESGVISLTPAVAVPLWAVDIPVATD